MTVQSLGAPQAAYAGDNFVIIRGEAVRALGSWESAGVFQRVAWRCERQPTDEWRATIAEISAEVWLSNHKTRKALDHLRAKGWLTSRPTSVLDSTQLWRVVWEGDTAPHPDEENHHPGAETPMPPLGESAAKGDEIPHPSYKTGDNYKTKTLSEKSVDEQPDDAAERLCEYLVQLHSKQGIPSTVTVAWRAAAKQLLEKYDERQIRKAMQFAVENEFWSTRAGTEMPLVLKHIKKLVAGAATARRAYSDADSWGDRRVVYDLTPEQDAAERGVPVELILAERKGANGEDMTDAEWKLFFGITENTEDVAPTETAGEPERPARCLHHHSAPHGGQGCAKAGQ